MNDLYLHGDDSPSTLPDYLFDETGNSYSAPFSSELLSDLGFILVPPKPDDTETQIAVWAGDGWTMEDRPPAPPSTPEDMARQIDAEHDRRTLLGRAFPVDGVGDVPLEGSERTQLVLLALKDTARDLRDADVAAPLLMLTDRDGTDRWMNATQMIALVNAGKAWMQQVHEAKRTLKAMDPIPADFAEDRHWPPLV